MAKQDVLDAINATIVENGQKGITAQSLNNILTMMTENAGEGGGSGDGLLRLNIPNIVILTTIHDLIGTSAFNQAVWDEVYATMSESGQEIPNVNEVVPTMLAQNAEVLEQIWSKFEEGKYPVVTLDDGLMYNAYMEDAIPMFQEQFPELTEEQIRNLLFYELPKKSILGIPGTSVIQISDTEVARVLWFKIYSSIDGDFTYNTGGLIQVLLDDIPDEAAAGTMQFTIRPLTYLYFPQDGATLSSGQKSSNVYDYYNFAIDGGENQAALLEYFTPHLVNAEGAATAQPSSFFITADFHDKKFKYFDGLSLKEAVIASDGSVTVTTLGTISTSEGSGVVTFYATGTGEELPSEYKSKNAEAFSAYKAGSIVTIACIAEGELVSTLYPGSVMLVDESLQCGMYQYNGEGGVVVISFLFNSDGSVTMQ